jgi:hypothetical protein
MGKVLTLKLVRQQLDELAFFRLAGDLGPELGQTYISLCDQERVLLTG